MKRGWRGSSSIFARSVVTHRSTLRSVTITRVAPDGVQDIVARQRPALAGDEVFQQAKLLGGQLHLTAAAEQLVRRRVQLEFPEAEHLGGLVLRRRRKAFARASSSRMRNGLVT